MIKKLTKPIYLILMLIIFTLIFSACSTVELTTKTNSDNTIDEVVTISLDEAEIVNAGYSLNLLKTNIKLKAIDEAENICKEFNEKIDSDLLLDITDETKKILNSYKNGIEPICSDWNNNTFTIAIRFKSVDVYKYYYNINDKLTIKYNVEEHFFYNKVYYYANTKYVAYNNLFNRLYNYYSIRYFNLIESENNNIVYTYVTDLRREHSDADFINKINGKYYHTWIIDPENINEPIIIYYNVANTGNCILVCLALTFVLTLILFLIALIKNKINKKINKNRKN